MHFIVQKLLAPLAILGVIIFVHEFGHFITAKLFRIRVFVFSFGFGQRLLGFKWGDTDCRLSLVPLGGYVKLEGEPDDPLSERQEAVALSDGEIVHVDSPDYFTNRPRWQRIIVYLAGPFMNAVLTVGIFTAVYMHGAELPDFSDTPIVALVEPGSPAAAAGIVPGDEITAVDGERQKTWEQVLLAIGLRPGRQLDLTLRNGSKERHVSLRSDVVDGQFGDIGVHPLVLVGNVVVDGPADRAGVKPGDIVLRIDGKQIGKFDEIPPLVAAAVGRPLALELSRGGQLLHVGVTPRDGRIGISGGPRNVYKKYPFPRAVTEALRYTGDQIVQIGQMLRQLVLRRISPKTSLSGPLEIFRASGEAAAGGLLPVVMLTALISLSVGILNLLPMPPLDGGHLAILAVEATIRRDVSPAAKIWIMNAGAILLLGLIAVVIYFDLTKQAWFHRLMGQ